MIFVLSCPSVPCCFFLNAKFAFLFMMRRGSFSPLFCIEKLNYSIYWGSVMEPSGASDDSWWWSSSLRAHWRGAISCWDLCNEYWLNCHQEMIHTGHIHHISSISSSTAAHIHTHAHSNTIWGPWEADRAHLPIEAEYLNMFTSQRADLWFLLQIQAGCQHLKWEN